MVSQPNLLKPNLVGTASRSAKYILDPLRGVFSEIRRKKEFYHWIFLLPCSWLALRAIGKSRTVRTSYLWLFAVPIAAKALAEFPREILVVFYGKELPLQISLPFSWHMFFFAAISFAIATTVFEARCPGLIKDFESLADFKEKSHSGTTLIRAMRELDGHAGKLISDGHGFWEFCKRYVKLQGSDVQNPAASCPPDEDPDPERYFEYRERVVIEGNIHHGEFGDAFEGARIALRKARPVGLVISCFFFVVGFVLISFVVFQNVVFVIREFMY